jgi:hypothetical protein
MNEPVVSYRRIDRLKAIAFDCGFTNEDAKQFGKLSKTATWEALLELYLVDGESLDALTVDTVDSTRDFVNTLPKTFEIEDVDSVDTLDGTNDGSFPVCSFTYQNSTSFLDWVDFGQLIALVLASAGAFVLVSR